MYSVVVFSLLISRIYIDISPGTARQMSVNEFVELLMEFFGTVQVESLQVWLGGDLPQVFRVFYNTDVSTAILIAKDLRGLTSNAEQILRVNARYGRIVSANDE